MDRVIYTPPTRGQAPGAGWASAIGLHLLIGVAAIARHEAPAPPAARENVVIVSLIERAAPVELAAPAIATWAVEPSDLAQASDLWDWVLTAPDAAPAERDRFSVAPLGADTEAALIALSRCQSESGEKRADCFALGEPLAAASAHAALDDPTPGDALSDPRFAGLDAEALRVAKGVQRRFAWSAPTVKTTGVRLRSLSSAFGGDILPTPDDAIDPGFGD